MSDLESDLEEFFRKRVRLVGGYTLKLAPMEAGVPDRLVVFPGGRLFLVELKTEQGSPSPIQRHWHKKLLRLGVRVYVLVGREGVLDWLRSVIETSGPRSKHRGVLPQA